MQWGRAAFLSTRRNPAFQGAALDKMSEGRCSEKDSDHEIGMAFAGEPFGFQEIDQAKGAVVEHRAFPERHVDE